MSKIVSIASIVGKGYRDIWNFKGRYKVIKGSRGSKKSKTTALWIIYNMMKYKDSNTLIVRKVFRTLKDSCFAELKWACVQLGVANKWKFNTSPLEATYIPTGQKILFRGLDDPLKITSIAIDKGFLCWVWFEEAYEIMSEDSFKTVVESIRGKLPEHLFYQFIVTLNPWSDKHWIKKRFFDTTDSDVMAVTTTYKCNEFLDQGNIDELEKLKETNPRRYKVAALGEWGITDGLVFENWEERYFDFREIIRVYSGIKPVFGLDFGYTNDPTAFFCGLLDLENKNLYVFNEFYEKGLQNNQIYQKIENMGFNKEKIVADSAEQKSIDYLRMLGLNRIIPAKKGPDSINAGIAFLQEFKIIVHPNCVNFLNEISTYCWDKDKFDKQINKPIDDNNHLMDAMRYSVEEYMKKKSYRFKL
ncbi:PBSX family phage terminase large subunit [Sneathia sanguinegens]|uniref:PBSX family phage terminase large subunit n=1 Tax=Sneathia sanguinegens TaxID=40543 RepID=UPI002583CD06|nr:PBSX family phage terminase large subunit [Sneathia sanguinegens]MDU4652597.1 PBSX family phage terminase large subunit [Sneathia sanguinegens]